MAWPTTRASKSVRIKKMRTLHLHTTYLTTWMKLLVGFIFQFESNSSQECKCSSVHLSDKNALLMLWEFNYKHNQRELLHKYNRSLNLILNLYPMDWAEWSVCIASRKIVSSEEKGLPWTFEKEKMRDNPNYQRISWYLRPLARK